MPVRVGLALVDAVLDVVVLLFVELGLECLHLRLQRCFAIDRFLIKRLLRNSGSSAFAGYRCIERIQTNLQRSSLGMLRLKSKQQLCVIRCQLIALGPQRGNPTIALVGSLRAHFALRGDALGSRIVQCGVQGFEVGFDEGAGLRAASLRIATAAEPHHILVCRKTQHVALGLLKLAAHVLEHSFQKPAGIRIRCIFALHVGIDEGLRPGIGDRGRPCRRAAGVRYVDQARALDRRNVDSTKEQSRGKRLAVASSGRP